MQVDQLTTDRPEGYDFARITIGAVDGFQGTPHASPFVEGPRQVAGIHDVG